MMRILILSGKEALQEQIGDIRPLAKAISAFIESRSGYETLFCYYDVQNEYGLNPVKKDAVSIRGYLLEAEKRFGEVDIIMLLGGDRVIPFFRLDNPCDDADDRVLSDNPYASRDDNFVIPEIVCARIPDNNSADFMAGQLRKAESFNVGSFGLTAKVWLRASENVYRAVGRPEDLKVSPPVTSDNFDDAWLKEKLYLYFNVHGSKASANWYGQDGGAYPVAVQPRNVLKAGGVVASEACYGAYILDKSQDDAICLRFLAQEGVLGFCGSTTIAYGPSVPPSGEADLLVKYFFEYLEKGLTMGESFRNAKMDFARKALRRGGFLDDDDQKTLLQFVLYGDPTLRAHRQVVEA